MPTKKGPIPCHVFRNYTVANLRKDAKADKLATAAKIDAMDKSELCSLFMAHGRKNVRRMVKGLAVLGVVSGATIVATGAIIGFRRPR